MCEVCSTLSAQEELLSLEVPAQHLAEGQRPTLAKIPVHPWQPPCLTQHIKLCCFSILIPDGFLLVG